MPFNFKYATPAIFIALLFSTFLLSAQQKPLSELVEYTASFNQQKDYAPFSLSLRLKEYDQISEYVSSATILDYDSEMIKNLIVKKPKFISLNIPSKDGSNLILDLVEKSPLNEDFHLLESQNPKTSIPYNPGVYYRGTVRDNPNSIVAISFFDDDIIGVLSTDQKGNMILGKVDAEAAESTSNQLVFYQENKMNDANPFVCGSDNLPDYYRDIDEVVSTSSLPSCKTISVYLEADYLLYQDKGRTTKNTTNYISGLFNIVATLYENEQINTDIKTIFVWTKNDPYSKTSSQQALSSFGSRNRNNFDGDIAHLFSRSRNNLGGLAWVDVLCRSYNSSNNYGRFAFSNITTSYRSFPTYSWTTEVVTHEMGHNLGSPHTHRCVWGPKNNTALDNCAETEGNCARGPRPIGGGTIMSYCHLTSSGINFKNGFGEEPGNLIRFRVDNARCLGSTFSASINPDEDQIVYYGDSIKLKATPTGSKYNFVWFRNNDLIANETSSELTVTNHGEYFTEVTTNCTVESNVVDVTNKEFVASINFPALSGSRDSIGYEVPDTLDSQVSSTLTIDVPMDILNNIPPSSINHFVRLTTSYKGGFPTELSLLQMGVEGPPNSKVSIPDYSPSKNENSFRRNKSYMLDLGQIDPSGTWTFEFSNNNEIDKKRAIKINLILELVWIGPGQASSENIALCEVKGLILDPNLPNAAYLWSTGDTTETITINDIGTYSVTVTKGNLSSEDDIIISQPPTEFMVNETICANETYKFGTQNLTMSGTYIGELTSTQGCDSNVTLELTVLPEVFIRDSAAICYGDEFKGRKFFEGGIVDELFSASNGCDSIIRTTLTVHPEIQIDYDLILGCQNEGSEINVASKNGEAYNYLWEDGVAGNSRINIKQKNINVIVKNEQNCAQTIPIAVDHFDSISINYIVESTICFGDSNGKIDIITTSGSAPFNYMWGDGSTLSNRNNLNIGPYSLTIVDSNACSWNGNFEVSSPDEIQAQFDINAETQKEMDGRIVANPSGGISPYTYLWNDGNTQMIRDSMVAGNYTVTITDFNNCEKLFDVVLQNSTATSNIPDLNEFIVYPNPTTKSFNIRLSFDNPKDYSLSIHSLNGKLLQTRSYFNNNKMSENWSVETLSSGVYFVQLITNQGIHIKKLIVKK